MAPPDAQPPVVLVRGSGDVGSAVAHLLLRRGHGVVIHDVELPAAPRRGMAFADAVFDGACTLDGVRARRVDDLTALAQAVAARDEVCVTAGGLGFVLAAVQPDVLVDARMRKRDHPEPQRDLAPLTIGLGPNFVAGETTHLAIETQWGDALGAVVTAGATRGLAGEPRSFDDHARDRFVYAPVAGVLHTGAAIGDRVRAGEVVATIADERLAAPLDGILRGLTHDGVPVARGAKVLEVDPRGDVAAVVGIGERPRRIAEGVLDAIAARRVRGRTSRDEEEWHVGTEQSRGAEELTAEERQRLRRAHERLRAASKELEVLVATEPIKGRWAPELAPAEILDAARADLQRAYEGVALCHQEVLGWELPPRHE